MNKLTTKQFWVVGLMLFSLFFGAGNLIFPPMVGSMAGTNMFQTMLFFSITAVVLPVLGVIAVAKAKGLNHMGKKVSPWFATIFTVIIYLLMGPLVGIPRAGTIPFEIGLAPSLPKGPLFSVAQLAFTLVFFALTYWLSLNPHKMANRVGKYLSPILLVLMLSLFVCSFFNPMGNYAAPQEAYISSPMTEGFLQGYMTMDAAGALNFGLVIAIVINSFHITEEKQVIQSTIKTGILAGSLLLIVYFMLAHLGASSSNLFPNATNGAQILNASSQHIFGPFGAIIVASIFTLACLTTCVGLITSSAQYFASWTKRLSYRGWVRIWIVCSILIANIGLDAILKYSAPILTAIYPIAIVLILLTLCDSLFHSKKLVYAITIYSTAAVSIIESLQEFGLNIPILTATVHKLPMASVSLGWVMPACFAFIISWSYSKAKNKKLVPSIVKEK